MIKKRQYSGSWRIEVVAHVSFTLAALACMLSILLMATAPLMDNDILNTRGYSYLPEEWSLTTYEFLFTQSTVTTRLIGVSALVAAAGTAAGLLLTMMLAYALAWGELPFRRVLTFSVMSTLLFNGGMVPTYFMYVNYSYIKNVLFGQLTPSLLVNGFSVILMRDCFRGNIPKELIESAHIDGAEGLHTFFSIALPISTPILATVGLPIGISYWNDWYNGMLYVTGPGLFSMQNFLNKIMMDIQFLSQNGSVISDVNSIMANIPSGTVRMAMASIATTSVMITFGFIREYFTKGLIVGLVKG